MRPKEKPPKIKMTVHPYVSQLEFNWFINFQHFDSNSNLILSVKINTDLLSMILKIDYFLLVESYGLFWKNEINKLWIIRPNSLIRIPIHFMIFFFRGRWMIVTVWGRPVTVDAGDQTTSSIPHGTTTPQVCILPSLQGGGSRNFFPWKRGRG